MQRKKLVLTAAALAAAIALAGYALAQSPHAHPQAAAVGDQSASSLAYQAVNAKMHRDMAIAYSGDADADFVRGMIPHHQGAIDMAKIVLAFGKDAEIKKLAEEVVKAQEGEIAQMRTWLTKRGR